MDGKDVYAQNDEQLAIFAAGRWGSYISFTTLYRVKCSGEYYTSGTYGRKKVNKERLEELIETLNLKGREIICPISCREASSKGCPLAGH